jgi:AcrR family transcriptional regulator
MSPPMSEHRQSSTRSRLLASGSQLMADKGFDGASVREICSLAGTSSNMVHHYFGSKRGLLDAIVEQFSSGVFALPMRLLDKDPQSEPEFLTIIQLLFESTLDAFIEHRSVMLVVIREQADPEALPEYMKRFAAFLERAKENGFVRDEVETDMITGFFLDRILNQVQLAPWINRNYGTDLLSDPEYKRRWCQSNLDVLLNGIAASD